MFGDEPAGLHKVARPAPDTLSLASVGRRKFNNLLDSGFFIGVIQAAADIGLRHPWAVRFPSLIYHFAEVQFYPLSNRGYDST